MANTSGQWAVIAENDGVHTLYSAELHALQNGDVLDKAGEALDLLNGLARLEHPRHRPVRLSGVIDQVNPDGRRGVTICVPPARLEITGHPPTVSAGGASNSLPPPDPRDQRYAKALKHQEAKDALIALGKEPSWQKLRYSFEVVRQMAGGDGGLILRGWTTQAEINRFKANAEDKRVSGYEAVHGKNFQHLPLGTPMTLEEGAAYVARIVSRWMDQEL